MQIRHPKTDQIVGTGIAVSMDGKIVTCAHVVLAAGVNPRLGKRIPGSWEIVLKSIFGKKPDNLKDAKDAEVVVYFPQARGGEEKKRRAKVAACFPEHDDDAVILQLTDGPSPLAPEQIAILGTAEPSKGNPFRSYEYRPLGKYKASYADGTIMGCIECPEQLPLQAEPVQLKSQHINFGMSGSPVLDNKRNLIIGIISETWFPDKSPKDRDTGWAVDAKVLSFNPMLLPVQEESLPLVVASQPKTDIKAAREQVALKDKIAWNNAPALIPEWVGREDLLKEINSDWGNPDCKITGLIGFGGEGKSSLARQWVENLLNNESQQQPDGVFWWGFYTRPSVDEFFESALKFMGGGKIDPRNYASPSAKAHLIAGMLHAGRYLFILDGLEIMQNQEGDQYGLLKSTDLRDFLEYFADPKHNSHCLITSRAPVLDLMDYTTYTHRDLTRLNPTDGRALLEKIGVKGSKDALDKVVTEWDGHALTISLLGSYLMKQHKGDVSKIKEIPPPVADEPRYERVHRVLRRYDEHLNDAERAFLTLFSAFRTPVEEKAFEKVFRAKMDSNALNAPIAELNDTDFKAIIKRLLDYRILRYDPRDRSYTAHPLIRSHYLAIFTKGKPEQSKDVHKQIKDYYLSIAGDTPYNPTLDDLKPLIEVVHHACSSGAYDEAYRVYLDRIYQSENFVLTAKIGAWETASALWLEFFPHRDASQDPQVSELKDKSWILNDAGLCLMCLGRLSETTPLYERAVAGYLKDENWRNASRVYRNLVDIHIYLGNFPAAKDATDNALSLARNIKSQTEESDALTYQSWIDNLKGDLLTATKTFKQAEDLQKKEQPDKHYLYSIYGIQHAEHLLCIGEVDYAQRVTDENLKICNNELWQHQISQCHRVFGDLDSQENKHESARKNYNDALKIARNITVRFVLIEALLARGRWYAKHMKDAPAAFSDLNEALDYAVDGGYRIYEADIRIALAWAHLADKKPKEARAEAEHALRMSKDMGYYWGKKDAQEVLGEIEKKK
ncbi:MAG: hypothetical protein AMJ90_03890 [candidate division Zixibacteria bacterium SM23_73_2]|nr:MAG: hypothetical protein AMJ90_03890 [candidate division Zixibacteria bacterium SM23_73_2]